MRCILGVTLGVSQREYESKRARFGDTSNALSCRPRKAGDRPDTLENRCTGNRTWGSNPSPSARFILPDPSTLTVLPS